MVLTYCEDTDNDGLGNPDTESEFCDALVEAGWILDCSDPEPDCSSNDTDVCGVCGGPGLYTFYYDEDGDGLGDPNVSLLACTDPGFFWVDNGDDLDDDCYSNEYTDWYADIDNDGLCDDSNPTDTQLCNDM